LQAGGQFLLRAGEVVDRRRAAFGLEPSQLAHRLVFLTADGALLQVASEEGKAYVGILTRNFKIHVDRQKLEARGTPELLVLCPRDEPQQPLELASDHMMLLQIGAASVRDLTR
jgi:hypothetical protein